MKKELIGLLICILLILTTILPASGNKSIAKAETDKQEVALVKSNGVDWWPMYHHDLQLTGYSTSMAPNTNKVLWTAGTFDYSWYSPQRSSPTIVNDTIYLGVIDPSFPLDNNLISEKIFDEYNLPIRSFFNFTSISIGASFQDRWNEAYLICMNASTGMEKWITRLDDEFYIQGSPAVAEGKVYITTTDFFGSPIGQLFCLNAINGSILWSFPLNETWDVSPVVYDERVYVSGWILDENSYKICKLFCLNASSGVEIFNTSLGFGEPIEAAAIYNNSVYVTVWDEYACITYLNCVNALNGNLKWNINTFGNYVGSSPVVYNDKIYVTSGYYDGYETICSYFLCLDTETGNVLWNHYIENGINAWSTPAIAYDRVFFTVSNEFIDTGWLYCLNTSTGNILWSKFLSDKGVFYSSPVIADGKIYLNSLSYVDFHGDLYCLNVINGENIWDYWLIYGMYSSPTIANDRLYLAIAGQFFTFDDNAPTNELPIVNISGPKYGNPGKIYDYTIYVNDPEDSNLLVTFRESQEFPDMTSWEMSSGETEIVSLFFQEEGDYWAQVRVQDEQYAWSEWERINIKIQKNKSRPDLFLLKFLERYPLLQTLLMRLGLQ